MNNNNYIIYFVKNWWCFPPCESGWRTSKEMIRLRESTDHEKDVEVRCPDMQTGRVTVEIAIFSYCRRKCTDSLITNVHSGIRALHRKLKAQLIRDLRWCCEFWGLRASLNPEVPLHKGHHGSSSEAAQPNEPVVFERDGYNGLRPSDSPLSGEITKLNFQEKFVLPTFDHYSGTSDTLLHLRQYHDKMEIYAHDDLHLYWAFPSSLKGAGYNWFYLLPKNSL